MENSICNSRPYGRQGHRSNQKAFVVGLGEASPILKRAMQTALLLSLLSLLTVLPVGGQQPEELPALKGIVTRAASPSDFDVNTVRIVCDERL